MDDFRVDGSVVGYDVVAAAVLDEGDYDICLPFFVDEKYGFSWNNRKRKVLCDFVSCEMLEARVILLLQTEKTFQLFKLSLVFK